MYFFVKKYIFFGSNKKIRIIVDSLNSGLSLNSSRTKKTKTENSSRVYYSGRYGNLISYFC